MLRRYALLKTLIVVFGFCFSIMAYAGVNVVISVAPPVREVVQPPSGYMQCYEVPGGFNDGIWEDRHSICQYDNDQYGGSWIAGYWSCNHYRHNGVCMRWGWVPSHWVNAGRNEYGVRPFELRRYHHYHTKYDNHHRYEREYHTDVPANGGYEGGHSRDNNGGYNNGGYQGH